MKYSILTPSRNRPDRLITHVDSILDRAQYPEYVEIMVYVDFDDPSLERYNELQYYRGIKIVFGPSQSISKSWNIIASQSTGDVMIMGNDDQEYQTLAWDTLLQTQLEQFQDEIYVAWMDDGINQERHCAFPIISRTWYQTLGYFAPGVFNFGYNDTWIYDIGKRLDRCLYIPHIKALHRHFSKYPDVRDDTYDRNRTQSRGNLYKLDEKIYHNTQAQRQRDAHKLRKLTW